MVISAAMPAPASVLVIDDSPTICKVVQLVLTKGGFDVRTAPDGELGIEMARERRPDVILLDFVMPRMNGYQVCRALAEEDGLKSVPVVLMSAKGDQVGERFVKVMGIVDYITKPFSPEAILAVVTHVLEKQQAASEAGDDDKEPLLPELEEEDLISAAEAIVEAADQATAARREALEDVRTSVASRILQRFIDTADDVDDKSALADEETQERLRETIRGALDDGALEAILSAVRATSPELVAGPDAVLTGDLRVVPLAEVLQLLAVQHQGGILTVSRSQGSSAAKVDVYFRNGKIDLASAAGVSEEFLLGRFIVEAKLMSREDLELFLRSRGDAPTKLFGAQLVKLGYVTEAELKQVIAQQTSELVYEILRWKSGRFTFRAAKELPPVALDASLGLAVDGLLMEGFRRVDEWHLIEREVDNFDTVFLRNEDALAQIGRGRLTREELTVLELVNGKHSVKDIIRQSRMGSFDVTKMLYRLLSIKLIRKRVMPVAV